MGVLSLPGDLSCPILKFFALYIQKETGIIYSKDNAYQLEKRLKEICQILAVESEEALFMKATKEGIQGHFKQLLLDMATNNETLFFRDPKIFNAFERFILPQILERNPFPASIKIWSVASSFGQEPYSLAMIIQEMEDRKVLLPPVDIWTTDLSAKAINRVKLGKYSQLEIQRGLPAKMLVKYFDKTAEAEWTLKDSIKKRVRSGYMNLLNLEGIRGTFDVLFCRNVLIYQTEEKKKEILRNLTPFVAPGGFTVLGAAENLIGLSSDYQQISFEGAIFYQKK